MFSLLTEVEIIRLIIFGVNTVDIEFLFFLVQVSTNECPGFPSLMPKFISNNILLSELKSVLQPHCLKVLQHAICRQKAHLQCPGRSVSILLCHSKYTKWGSLLVSTLTLSLTTIWLLTLQPFVLLPKLKHTQLCEEDEDDYTYDIYYQFLQNFVLVVDVEVVEDVEHSVLSFTVIH